jgi:6-phosphofructokinase 2
MARIVTLTMNPAVDVSTSVDRVEPVRKLRCGAGRRDPGGGGINVGRVANRLGAEVTAVYPAGGFVGRLLERLVEAEGVKSVAVPVQAETREDFTVLDEATGQQYRFVLPGPHLGGVEWMECLKALAAHVAPGGGTDFVCVSGSLPPGVPDEFYARAAEIVGSWGVRLALDTSGPSFRAALEEKIYLVKPNLRELQELTGAPLNDEDAQVAACRGLIERHGVEVVALTLGADGALLITRERAWRAQPLAIQPVSTVGAGDSFLGAMVWALASGKSLEDAFRFAVAGGSAALLAHGTELCRPEDVRRLLGQVTIEIISDSGAAAA